MVGERCYVLGPNNKWIDVFVTGTKDSGRSYDTQVEATGGNLMRNRSHIRPRGPDIPQIHESYLQRNSVLSGTPDRKAAEKQNSVTSGQLAKPNSQKTVLSGKSTRNIKPTNTSQILVSEQEGPAEQRGQEDQVSRQPCEQHCASTTKKAART